MRALVWLRNELRLKDNLLISAAVDEADEVILFYCFDTKDYQQTPLGFPKTGSFRAQFILEALEDLQNNLGVASAALQIRIGNTREEIERIHKEFPIDRIYCSEECTAEEVERENSLVEAGFQLEQFWQSTLYHPEDLPMTINQLPQVFTAFRKKAEKYGSIQATEEAVSPNKWPKELELNTLPGLKDLGLPNTPKDERAVLIFKGGETEAWKRLKDYFWDKDLLKVYKETRNGLVGADYSSKFSPWLALGCISPRSIYEEIKSYEAQRKKNSSTYWLYFELMWRDFFRLSALKEGEDFFKIPRNYQPKVRKNFQAWREGRTGQDFVDANMKELARTGFMSNRGRQNVASYLVKDLGEHWYLGAQWFESQLIDYDVCSNYGNWTYVAGVGNDPREDRWFNVKGQADRYDPQREYRKLWQD